jgi:hypothetical protein
MAVPQEVLVEYQHVTRNAQDVTEQSMKMLHFYILMVGVFGAGVGYFAKEFNPSKYTFFILAACLCILVTLSTRFKYALFKLRYSFIEWIAHAIEIRKNYPSFTGEGQVKDRISYVNIDIGSDTSVFMYVIRIISFIKCVLLSSMVFAEVMFIGYALYDTQWPFEIVALFACLSLPMFHVLERRYDHDSMHELRHHMIHHHSYINTLSSLCLSLLPCTIIIFGSLFETFENLKENKETNQVAYILGNCLLWFVSLFATIIIISSIFGLIPLEVYSRVGIMFLGIVLLLITLSLWHVLRVGICYQNLLRFVARIIEIFIILAIVWWLGVFVVLIDGILFMRVYTFTNLTITSLLLMPILIVVGLRSASIKRAILATSRGLACYLATRCSCYNRLHAGDGCYLDKLPADT